jgi:hypothetical protein
MNPVAIQPMKVNQPGEPAPNRPTAEHSRRGLEEHVWSLPLLDERCADAILGDCSPSPGVEPAAGCTNNPGPLNWSDNQTAGGRR